MDRAGLFGGGWQDYFDALNEAFDRHVAENMPPHPFGASIDAIMTGYADDAGAPSGVAPGNTGSFGAGVLRPAFNSSMVPQASDAFLRNSA